MNDLLVESLEITEAEALPITMIEEAEPVQPHTSVLDAIALLVEAADELKEGVSIAGVPDWQGEPETKAWYDRHLRAAEAVSNLSHCLDVAVELAAQYAAMIAAAPPPPKLEPLTKAEIYALAHRKCSRYKHDADTRKIEYTFHPHTLNDFLSAIAAHGITPKESAG